MKPAEQSSQESDAVLALVQRVLPSAGVYFVRKAAHFAEYFVLGALVGGCCALRWRPVLLWPLLGCAGVAALDEFLQTFYEGRSGELRDVLLDSLGALCALLLFMLCRRFSRKQS